MKPAGPGGGSKLWLATVPSQVGVGEAMGTCRGRSSSMTASSSCLRGAVARRRRGEHRWHGPVGNGGGPAGRGAASSTSSWWTSISVGRAASIWPAAWPRSCRRRSVVLISTHTEAEVGGDRRRPSPAGRVHSQVAARRGRGERVSSLRASNQFGAERERDSDRRSLPGRARQRQTPAEGLDAVDEPVRPEPRSVSAPPIPSSRTLARRQLSATLSSTLT